MAPPLIRYGLDLTGTNSDNFVSNEVHVLEKRRNRAAAPKYGAFFADGLTVIEQSNGRILTRGIHYVPIELYQTVSLMTGKDIFGAVLIIDSDVTSPINLSYNCLGGEYSRSAQPLIDLLAKMPDDRLEYSWFDILNKPDYFKPTEHLHPIGDAVGFQYLVQALEKIRNAILWTDTPMYQNLIDYINSVLDDLDQQMKYKMDSYMGPILVAFKRQLTKAFLGLENVENLRLATEEEGRTAARQDTRVSNFAERKYTALSTIVAFKNVLYENFVSSEETNIGKSRGVRKNPVRLNLLNLVNGAIVSLMSKAEARSSNTVFDSDVYPTGSDDSDQFTIVKVTNNRTNRGGIFLAYQQQGKACYIGVHLTGKDSDLISWRRFSFADDLDGLSLKISNHIQDTNNPHKVTKTQVNLKQVENLPVIDRSEILCLDPVRKYVTFDALLLFMKTFMIGKTGGINDPNNNTTDPLENVQILYCPSSNCNCDSETPSPTYPPMGTLISQACVGFNMVGTYANGTGSTYTSVIAANSPECGYEEPIDTPVVTGLNVTTSVSTNLNWTVVGGKKNTTFTHQYGLPGQTPVTNTYTLNSSGSFAGTLNTGPAAGTIQSTFIFVNNFTVVQNTVVQAQVTATGAPSNLNSAVLSSSKNTLPIGDTSILNVDISGMVASRMYNVEYWNKLSTESSFVRVIHPDIPGNYNATGPTGQFNFPLSNDGTTAGMYNSYIKITDATNSANSINTNTVSVTFVSPPPPPPPPGPPPPPPPGPPPPPPPAALLNSAVLTLSRVDFSVGDSSNVSLNFGSTSTSKNYNIQMVGRTVGSTTWAPWVAATMYPRSIPGSASSTSRTWVETHNDTAPVSYITTMDVKGIITDAANSSNRVETNIVTITIRPPITTPSPVSIISVIGSGPRTNPIPANSLGYSDWNVSGLIPGKSYDVDYFAKYSTDSSFTRINDMVEAQYLPTKSFTASGNTHSFYSVHNNLGSSPSATFNYYIVVKQSDNATNSRQSNTCTVTQSGPASTPPPTSATLYKQVTMRSQQGSNIIGVAGVARQSDGSLQFNLSMSLAGTTQVWFQKPGSFWDNPIETVVNVQSSSCTDLGSNNYATNRNISVDEWNSINEVWVTFNDNNFA